MRFYRSASCNIVCIMTFAPASRSSGEVYSAGLWLMPFTLGVKTMAGADPREHLRVVTGT